MTGLIAAAVWQTAAVIFLAAVVLTVRKAKARGKRLFVDQPTARAKALHHSPINRSQEGIQ